MVPKAGLEPARREALPPQDSVSTSSTTSAWVYFTVFLMKFIRLVRRVRQILLHWLPELGLRWLLSRLPGFVQERLT